jgi:hypothetical protein
LRTFAAAFPVSIDLAPSRVAVARREFVGRHLKTLAVFEQVAE